ncbi:unnamed protein product [Caenorhabditis auriculariae]|uniref:Uncharacterized protein n=1 Tax=Caenorhabditis auriculariae TaxID=2777116 RepID=A0A8S1GU62_9PELO|nr:unnamed protein product [Caenorhabditis auriculariae]
MVAGKDGEADDSVGKKKVWEVLVDRRSPPKEVLTGSENSVQCFLSLLREKGYSRKINVLLIVFFLAFVPLGFFYHALLLESEEPEELQSQFDASRFYSDLLKFNQSECAFFPSNIAKTHPQCLRKMQWLQKGWRSHTCYSQQLVDGSLCSFRRYLSVVERNCILLR